MTRKIFREDRHLYFTNCLIEPGRPPMSTFMNAKLPYDILTVKLGHRAQVIVDLNETIDLWRHLGQTVTEIYVDRLTMEQPNLYHILLEMPNCEVLGFYLKLTGHGFNPKLESITKDLLILREDNPDKEFLKKLKTLKVDEYDIVEYQKTLDDFMQVRQIIPENAEVIIKTVTVSVGSEIFDRIFSLVKNVKADVMLVPFSHDFTDPLLQRIRAAENVPFQNIRLLYPHNSAPFDALKAFCDKNRSVGIVQITVYPLLCPFEHVTEVVLDDCDLPTRSLKFLEPLVNLLDISIFIHEDDECLFGHEVVNLPKLRRFAVHYANITCVECLTALANSFPNLVKLSVNVHVNIDHLILRNDRQILEMMLKNWRYLEDMEFFYFMELEKFAKAVENLGETRLSLRHLKLYANRVSRPSSEHFIKISKVFPHLHTLDITTRDEYKFGDVEDLIKGIIPAFKELSTIQIRIDLNHEYYSIMDHSEPILEQIERHGHSLRVSGRFYSQDSFSNLFFLSICKCLNLIWMKIEQFDYTKTMNSFVLSTTVVPPDLN